MEEMTEERAQIIDLKRRLRTVTAERDRYLSSYVQLLEERSSSPRGCRHDYCERCGEHLSEDTTHSCPSEKRWSYDATSPASGGTSHTETDRTCQEMRTYSGSTTTTQR